MMVAEHEAGRRPINRSRHWQSESRKQEKVRKKGNWYKTGGYSTVIFCPYTPGGELAKKWREIEAREVDTRGWRVQWQTSKIYSLQKSLDRNLQ